MQFKLSQIEKKSQLISCLCSLHNFGVNHTDKYLIRSIRKFVCMPVKNLLEIRLNNNNNASSTVKQPYGRQSVYCLTYAQFYGGISRRNPISDSSIVHFNALLKSLRNHIQIRPEHVGTIATTLN